MVTGKREDVVITHEFELCVGMFWLCGPGSLPDLTDLPL